MALNILPEDGNVDRLGCFWSGRSHQSSDWWHLLEHETVVGLMRSIFKWYLSRDHGAAEIRIAAVNPAIPRF